MADMLKSTIDFLLAEHPDLFKQRAPTPGQGSGSSSAAQPKTNPKLKIAVMGREFLSDATKAELDHIGESEQIVPTESSKSEASDLSNGRRPEFSDGSPPANLGDSKVHHHFESAPSSKSTEGKAEPSPSKLMKLAEEYDQSPDKEKEQSLSDLMLKLPASSNKSPAKRSTSPPLDHALGLKNFILGNQKPRASGLRNEIHRSPADDDKLEQTKGKESRANADLLKESPAFQGRATDRNETSRFGKRVDVAKANEPATSVGLLTTIKAHKERTTKEKTVEEGVERNWQFQTTLAKGSVADKNIQKPPVVLLNENLEPLGFISRVLASSSGTNPPRGLEPRKSGVGLSLDELIKVPDEFTHHHQSILARFWDLAYNPVVRKTVLDYKQSLAMAGEADKGLDWPNKLLATLVGVLEAEILGLAEHAFDATDINTIESEDDESAIPEQSAELYAALCELQKSILNPEYNTTTARETLASSNGVKKLDLPILTQVLLCIYEELRALHDVAQMDATPSEKRKMMLEKMAAAKLQALGKGKDEEGELATEDETTDKGKGKGKGKEGGIPMEGLTIGKGNGKDNELPEEDAKDSKGKAKESDVFVKDPDSGESKGKENDLPLKDATISKGKGKGKKKGKGKGKGKEKENEPIEEGPTTQNGKGKEDDLPLVDTTVSKGEHEDFDHHEASERKMDSDLFDIDASLFVDLDSIPLKLRAQAPLSTKEKIKLVAYEIVEDFIRPQKASLAQVQLLCSILTRPAIFEAMTPVIEELRWNR